jgi:hypothetical protein
MTAPAPRILAAIALVGALTVPAVAAPAVPTLRKPSPYPSVAGAQAPVELVEDVDGLKINWTTGRLTASGIGVPGDRGNMAYRRALSSRAATADAYRRFAGALDMVRVDANTRLKDLAISDDSLRTRLNDFVKGAKVLETNYWPDGSAEVVLGADLRGASSLASLVSKAAAAAPASAAPAASPTPEIVTEAAPIRASYSALIVVAKGLGAQPALMPAVRDESGKPIELAGVNVHHPVKYLRDGAELDAAAGVNPLKVTANRTQGALRADLVLNAADAKALKTGLVENKLGDDAPIIVVL